MEGEMRRFRATHVVHAFGVKQRVMLVEGCAYKKDEWGCEAGADFEVDDGGRWLFQGQSFTGFVRRLSG